MNKSSYQNIKACAIAVLLCSCMLCMPHPTNALSNTMKTAGSGGGSNHHHLGTVSNNDNGSTSNTLKLSPSTMTDVQRYLSSIGTTLDNVCGNHHYYYHHHHSHQISQRRGLNAGDDTEDINTNTIDTEEGGEGKGEEKNESKKAMYINAFMAVFCVCVAALAAGLTMGLLSQELLDLRIKEMAAADENIKAQAKSLVPLIKDHHRLLVTLLLMNALANEALPLFLDELVPSYVAVILSVSFVLFFGEIIPSAIFTGPNQLAISSKLAPLVRLVLVLLAPLAWPIAKLLDYFLHEEETLEKYDRGELMALVRLQYEEKRKAKMLKKAERVMITSASADSHRSSGGRADTRSNRFVSIVDEVNMVEGALQMQSRKVGDVMQNWNNVYSIPSDIVLNEANILDLYRSGYSRIPVFKSGKNGNKDATRNIIGLFKVRQLVVINAAEERPLSDIHLATPFCVAPTMNMVDLLNLLQEGKGHMAIVCMKPEIARDALSANKPIPESAEVVGLVTLEDCIEELIQEEIYDEYDRDEKITNYRSKWVIEKWRRFVAKKKAEREASDPTGDIVDENTQLIV